MTDLEAIKARHSVRVYEDKKIEVEKVEKLNNLVEKLNELSNLSISLNVNEPKAFGNIFATYGKFKNVSNYFVLAGKKCEDIDEKVGYYGEILVLEAQKLGLNTCWVGLTYSKGVVNKKIKKDEKVVCVISLGYGKTDGANRKSKTYSEVTDENNAPEWFKNGVMSALLAPTALNQQKFNFSLNKDGKVEAKRFNGFYSKVDLGIAKLHFEIGAGKENFDWAK